MWSSYKIVKTQIIPPVYETIEHEDGSCEEVMVEPAHLLTWRWWYIYKNLRAKMCGYKFTDEVLD